ncbi:retrovirus-related pol polyprotein from transposon TNT 1-94 [Tanacetum coccineum]
MVRALMYLTASRPDIVHATCYCARYQAKPTKKHLIVVKRIFRYLKDTINMGLWYPRDTGFELTAFLDSDHAGCLDLRKSTSGGIQFLSGDKLVSWSSKKQDCTSMSSAEAKYVSLSACCAQVLWLRTQLTDYGFYFDKIPMLKRVLLNYSLSELNMFTKASLEDRFKYLVRRLGRTDHPLGIWTQAIRKLSDGEIALRSSRNLHDKFIVIVRFMNDHFGAIMGYGDYVISDSMISRVYYVEGLGHNLFFVRQFCDSDLEVAFRKHSCYVRDTDDVELIKGSRGSNLYTISIEDMMKSSPICLLSKASKNKSWLWHRRLNHLNFGTINDLARIGIKAGKPRENCLPVLVINGDPREEYSL